jgi:hypothetical protein
MINKIKNWWNNLFILKKDKTRPSPEELSKPVEVDEITARFHLENGDVIIRIFKGSARWMYDGFFQEKWILAKNTRFI